MALIDTIDQQAGPQAKVASLISVAENLSHRQSFADSLRGHVAACPADNFLVRPHLELVERICKPEAWTTLTADDHALLASTLAPLPSAQAEQEGDTDAVARRFDLLLYSLQLSLLRGESRFLRLQKQVRQLAGQLEQMHSIPMVAAELELIQDLLRDEWWQDVTLPMLEEVRRRLRGLVGLIETEAQDPLYTDFSDEIVAIKEVDGAALLTRDEFRQFRLRAQNFLKQHEDYLTMQRLRRSQPLTSTDIQELQQFLISHGIGNQPLIEPASEEANGFGLFIRSLVGLDRNAAKELFAEYLAEGTHTTTQSRFINTILDELTSRGVMAPARLYDPPFTDLAPSGPEGLFSEAEVDNICQLLDLIRGRAVVAEAA